MNEFTRTRSLLRAPAALTRAQLIATSAWMVAMASILAVATALRLGFGRGIYTHPSGRLTVRPLLAGARAALGGGYFVLCFGRALSSIHRRRALS